MLSPKAHPIRFIASIPTAISAICPFSSISSIFIYCGKVSDENTVRGTEQVGDIVRERYLVCFDLIVRVYN